MSRKLLYVLPACFYLGFIGGRQLSQWVVFGLILLCALFPKKTVWALLIGVPPSLYFIHVTGALSLPYLVGFGFVCLLLLSLRRSDVGPKVLLSYCLAWFFLLAVIGGPYATVACVVFLFWLSLKLKKPWLILLIALAFVPATTLWPLSTIPRSSVNEVRSQAQTEEVSAYGQESEDSYGGTAKGNRQEVVTEWVMDQSMPLPLTRFFQWAFIGVGALFILAAVKFVRDYGKGRLALAKKAGIATLVLGSLFLLTYVLARIPPSGEPLIAEAQAFLEEQGQIGRYQAPSRGSGTLEEKIAPLIRTIEVTMTPINILAIAGTLTLLSFLLIRFIRRKPYKKEQEVVVNIPDIWTDETAAPDLNLDGSELVKAVYRWIRAKRYPAFAMLTPYELLAFHRSESFRRITDAFVRTEYGFSEAGISDDEIRELYHATRNEALLGNTWERGL